MAEKPSDIVPLQYRLRRGLLKKLQASAKKNDHSLNAELNARVEGTFDDESKGLQFHNAIELLAGNAENAKLLSMISSALHAATAYGDKDPASANNMEVFRYATNAIIAAHAGTPYEASPFAEWDQWPLNKKLGFLTANVILRSRDMPPCMEPRPEDSENSKLSYLSLADLGKVR